MSDQLYFPFSGTRQHILFDRQTRTEVTWDQVSFVEFYTKDGTAALNSPAGRLCHACKNTPEQMDDKMLCQFGRESNMLLYFVTLLTGKRFYRRVTNDPGWERYDALEQPPNRDGTVGSKSSHQAGAHAIACAVAVDVKA